MKIMEGERVKLFPLSLKDVYSMRNWGVHNNPLFHDYNFLDLNDEEIIEWYESKTININKKYFSVYNENNNMIGYLGIKDIRRLIKRATLGIVFDPNYINKGYGTESIKVFLDYFFNCLNMNTLFLDVSKFNERAICCYEKCGFKNMYQYLDKFTYQGVDIDSKYFQKQRHCFVIKHGKIYNYIYKMKINKYMYKMIYAVKG